MKGIGLYRRKSKWRKLSKNGSVYMISFLILFFLIGVLTALKPALQITSEKIEKWTSSIDGTSFLYLMQQENKIFSYAFPENIPEVSVTKVAFQLATQVKPTDPRTFLGRELPGVSTYNEQIIVAGEGTDYTTMPIESSPPFEVLDQNRVANVDESLLHEEEDTPHHAQGNTLGKPTVFVYQSHNRESFLPHLPKGTEPNSAVHKEVNISLVGKRFSKKLEENGIPTEYSNKDIPNLLKQMGLQYFESYSASREMVTEALAQNKSLSYLIDFHRDSQRYETTTTEINGQKYARTMFVIGGENEGYEKNLSLAMKLHEKLQEKYPGLSRGVITKKGAYTDGKFNQDLSQNSILVEVGGIDNSLEELYRTADVFADLFSEFYFDAEMVSGQKEE
ncbi:stage II sporulation protein P [Bacillaceae bacterium S4-13-56]